MNYIDPLGLCPADDAKGIDERLQYLADDVISFGERDFDRIQKYPNAALDPVQAVKSDLEAINNTYEFLFHSDTGEVRKGGKYQRVEVIRGKEERHHIPSVSAMENAGIDLGKYDGPVVVVDKEDHRRTGSWGSSREAKEYRADEEKLIMEGRFSEALEKGIQDLKNIAEQSGDPTKYDKAIQQMVDYWKTIDPSKYTPK